MRYVFLAAISSLALIHAQDRTYTGAHACGRCHPDEYRKQSATAHARALYPAAKHPLVSSFDTTPQHRSAYGYRFVSLPDEFRVSVFDAKDVMDVPIQWAFGAGEQAVTFVSRIDRDWYVENYFSYYPAIGKMAVTPGQQNIEPKRLPEAVGLVYKSLDAQEGIVRCFRCHATGPIDIAGAGISPSEIGVHCEACHGPASQHVRSSDPKHIENPRRMTAAELNNFCGECHRPPAAKGTQIDWNFPWNVRHQPVYLSQSACFRKSNGALSCLSCHKPHEDLRHEASYYNGICAGCHASAHASTRGMTNCIDCHMPRVTPQAPLRFTNHWVGIYGADSHLRPISND
jgi:Cytochrome c554 and c-prime